MNQGWIYTERVRANSSGQTVLNYYTQHYRHSSRAQWQARIEQGQVLLDDQRTSAAAVLKSGQHLAYQRPPWQEPQVPLEFEVLYEDGDLWAIAKPSGLPVLPGGDCLEHTLLYQMRSRYPNESPVPLHRLGRGTSGVILIAKSQQARVALSQQFRDRQLSKIYRALIGPASPSELPERFSCHYPIGKLPYAAMGYLYGHLPAIAAKAMAAHSDCHILHRRPTSTLVQVAISTGRPHQIRIHLAAAGYPLLGDPLYAVGGVPMVGGTAVASDGGYHLHSYRVRFTHPRTGKDISITATPPSILNMPAKRADWENGH
ncbi:MAG: RluA family pseudouridine synthase [Phormidesmis sp. RL_2_1]|nr:RluA family pseudouridine synthase [Phormidesmis sp. RL_2_1]